LGVCRDGCGVQLVLPLGGFQRPGQRVALGVGLRLTGRIVRKRQSPTRLGELGRPHHVERHHVQRLVVAGEPSSQLQPLVVGAFRQADLLDLETATQFFVAALGDCRERGHLVSRGVVIDDYSAATGSTRGYH
jgi:hypothetical protein